MEVLVEKVITSGQNLLELIAVLKRYALPADFSQKNEDVREWTQVHKDRAANVEECLHTLQADMTRTLQVGSSFEPTADGQAPHHKPDVVLMQELEQSYCSSRHKGPAAPEDMHVDYRNLLDLAMDVNLP